MPDSPESDFDSIQSKAETIARDKGAKGELMGKVEPIAFGLKKVIIMAMYEMDDDMDFDSISDEMAKIDGVSNAKVAKMDLAMG